MKCSSIRRDQNKRKSRPFSIRSVSSNLRSLRNQSNGPLFILWDASFLISSFNHLFVMCCSRTRRAYPKLKVRNLHKDSPDAEQWFFETLKSHDRYPLLFYKNKRMMPRHRLIAVPEITLFGGFAWFLLPVS